MRRLRILLFALLIGSGAICVPLRSGSVLASPHIPAVLSSFVPKLGKARIPVYLPSWLPPYRGRLQKAVTLYYHNTRYAVFLSRDKSFSYSSLVFWMAGDRVAADIGGKKVSLGHGITAYLNPHPHNPEGLTIGWQQGRDFYEIGGLRTESALVRAAKSVVRVH
jgi:hypothetical protein